MKTANISFAVMALLYSASATEVQQMSALESTSGVDVQGWCDMSRVQRSAWVKSQRVALRAQFTEARVELKKSIKGALANYKMARKEILAGYKANRTRIITEFRAAIKGQPKEERKAIITAFRKDLTDRRNAVRAQFKTLRDRFMANRKQIIDIYRRMVKSQKAEFIAQVKGFKKTEAECEAMESSSEEEPETESETMTEPETESEETVSEESEETASEESEEEPEPTKPVKVSQTCDGSLQRMYNEQTANLFEIAKKSTTKYTDVSFPADTSSVYWREAQLWSTSFAAELRKKTFNSWQRVGDLNTNANKDIWGSKGILPAGIQQGGLGDCWWLGAASALAEYPERIKKLFTNMDVNKGIYEFEFFSQGKANKVVIDDMIPTNGRGRVNFARKSPNGAWWLPLLEKASAKFFGTYENLNGGWGDVAFQQLTGYPTEMFQHSLGAEKLLEAVKMSDDSHHVMYCAGVKISVGGKFGLVPGHQYSLISHINWDGMDFVQVRNPWGTGEYTGAWSDTDKTTDALKLAAFRAHVKKIENHDVTNRDGMFWMEFKDYHNYFSGTSVGYYLGDYHHTSFQTSLEKNGVYTYYTLNNPVKQHVYLAADPISSFQFMDTKCEDEKKTHSDKVSRRIYFDMDGQKLLLDWRSDVGWRQDTFIQWKELPAGEFKIRAKTSFDGNAPGNFPFGLLAHASLKPVTIGL